MADTKIRLEMEKCVIHEEFMIFIRDIIYGFGNQLKSEFLLSENIQNDEMMNIDIEFKKNRKVGYFPVILNGEY